jgi:hypothetical protein
VRFTVRGYAWLSQRLLRPGYLHLAGLDFFYTPVDLGFPGGFGVRIAGVQILGQTAHQLAHFLRRPVARFLNDLVQCQCTAMNI